MVLTGEPTIIHESERHWLARKLTRRDKKGEYQSLSDSYVTRRSIQRCTSSAQRLPYTHLEIDHADSHISRTCCRQWLPGPWGRAFRDKRRRGHARRSDRESPTIMPRPIERWGRSCNRRSGRSTASMV